MAQETYYINCPHCGGIIEVVCPGIDMHVKKVTADKQWYFNQANATNTVACSNCGRDLVLYWYYHN